MLKIRHIGGERVEGGNYWNFETGERVTIEKDGVLPGDNSVRYYKAHPTLILMASPVLGLVYAAFLPFIGIAVLGKVITSKLFGRTADSMSRVTTFNWRPSEAYLAGKKKKEDEDKESKSNKDPGASE